MDNSKYIFAFAVITVVFALAFVVQKVANTIFFEVPERASQIVKTAEVPIDNELWLTKVEQKSEIGNFLADEFHLNWDLVDPEFTKIRVFLIRYQDIDKYQFACLSQVLKEEGIEGDVTEKESSYLVNIAIKDRQKAKRVIYLLDRYNIAGDYEEIYQFKERYK